MTKTQILKAFNKKFTMEWDKNQSWDDFTGAVSPEHMRDWLNTQLSLFEKAIREETLKEIKSVLDVMPHGAIYESNRYDTDNESKIHLWIKESHLKATGLEGISFDVVVPKERTVVREKRTSENKKA